MSGSFLHLKIAESARAPEGAKFKSYGSERLNPIKHTGNQHL
jgi:hypothetical protein